MEINDKNWSISVVRYFCFGTHHFSFFSQSDFSCNQCLYWFHALFFRISQSSRASYDHFTQEGLNASETARQKSVDLRSTLNTIHAHSIKDLRDQAIRVDIALEKKVKLTQDVLRQLEIELLCVRFVNATKYRRPGLRE